MDNVISILEQLGANAALTLPAAELQLDVALLQRLQLGDISAAEHYLGTRSGLICGIFPAKEPEPEPVPPAEQPDEDNAPDKSQRSQLLLRRA